MEYKYRPLFRRLIVFTTPRIEKRTKSGLYIPNSKRGTFGSLMRAWVVAASDKCHTSWQLGQCLLVQDMFEFDDFPHDLWETFKDKIEFSELAKFSKHFEATVTTQILMEDSVLAVEDAFSTDTCEELIKTKNYQHFVGAIP